MIGMEKRYGRWTVLNTDIPWHAHDKVPVQCMCGNYGDVELRFLASGKSQSCGCLQAELAGQRLANHNRGRTWPTDLAPPSDTRVERNARFGRWLVLEDPPKGVKHPRVKCVCDCGTETDVVAGNLTRKVRPSRSCGCLRADGAKAIHAS